MQAAAASLEAGTAPGVDSPARATPLQTGNGVRVRVSGSWNLISMTAQGLQGPCWAHQHQFPTPILLSILSGRPLQSLQLLDTRFDSAKLSKCLCLLQVQGLEKVYTTRKGSFLAADNISLDIPAGKMTALLGPSGSGRHNHNPPEDVTVLYLPWSLSIPRSEARSRCPVDAKQSALCRQDHAVAAYSRPGGALRRQHLL